MSRKLATTLLLLACPAIASTLDSNSMDVLVVPVTTITKFDPYMGNDMNLNKVMGQIALNLVALDDSLAPIPELAKSWSIDSKRKEITFELRNGKRFHDGTPIESKDIFSVFKKSVNNGSDLTSQLHGFNHCPTVQECPCFRAISPTRFTLKLTDSNFPLLLRKFAGVEGVIFKASPTNSQFVGSGPYKVKEVTADAIVTERINPKLRLRQIIFKKVAAAKGAEEFARGAVDVINNIDFTVDDKDIPKSAKRQDLIAVTFGFVFNLNEASVFHGAEVRRAVSLAIDKSEFIKHYGKRAIPANGLIPRGFLGYEDHGNPVEIEKAKALIANHVTTNKRQVVLGLRDRFSGNSSLESFLQETFAKIGLKLEIQYDDFNRILKDFRKNKYDLIMKGDTPRYYESSTVFVPYIDGQFQNISGFDNRELTDLYYSYERAVDLKQKIQMLSRMESIIRQEIPVLPLFYPVLSNWYQRSVETKNFKELSIRLWDFPYHKLAKQISP